MIIDAMDLLYTGRFASFCLVSIDSDFTRLAARIREQGVTVYGFGERKTNHAFIAACDHFTYFDVLSIEAEPEEQQQPSSAIVAQSSLSTPVKHKLDGTIVPPALVRTQPVRRPIDDAAVMGIAKAVANAPSYSENWVNLADVGKIMGKLSPDLRAKNYGYDKLGEFVEASDIVELEWKNMGDKPPVALVRMKRRERF